MMLLTSAVQKISKTYQDSIINYASKTSRDSVELCL